MAKSGTAPSQTTTYNPSPEQAELLSLAMPGIRKYAATTPQRYQGDTVSDFTAPQTQGQNMALDAAGGQANLAANGAAANNFMLGDIWNPSTNPALQGAVDASIRPITENYQQVVRPAVRDDLATAGQNFGGSRRAIAESNVANSYMRNVGDTAAKVVNDNYSTNINAQLKALGLLPQTQAALTQPAATVSGVGDVQQNQAQRELDATVGGWNYDQMAPFLQSKDIMSLLAGLPGASVTSTGNVPQASTGQRALGGAMTGASMGSAFGPWGALIGGGLGAGSAFV